MYGTIIIMLSLRMAYPFIIFTFESFSHSPLLSSDTHLSPLNTFIHSSFPFSSPVLCRNKTINVSYDEKLRCQKVEKEVVVEL